MSTQLGVMKNDGELRALIVRGQELGFLGLEEVAEVLDGLGLDTEAAEEVYQQLEEAGIDLLEQADANARAAEHADESERPRRSNTVVEQTTDALQLFLKDIGRVPLLTSAREVELSAAMERGDYLAACSVRFVEATGHVTFAEIPPDPKDYPGMLPELAHPGSLVFEKTAGPADLSDFGQWWDFRFGADWRHPTGPGSSLDGLEDHPVVHVTHGDALAYAKSPEYAAAKAMRQPVRCCSSQAPVTWSACTWVSSVATRRRPSSRSSARSRRACSKTGSISTASPASASR